MSYILDALRKSNAQRERAAMPGLQPQAAIVGPAPAPVRREAARWMLPSAMVLVVAVLAWGLWNWLGAAPATVAATVPATASNPASSVPVTRPVTKASGEAVTAVAEPATVPVRQPARSIDVPPAQAPKVRNDPTPRPAVVVKPSPKPPAAPAPAAMAVPSQARVEGRVYQLSELPDEIRRELPTLSVGGSVYSTDAASRVLIVNGQLFHERDVLAPGVSLDQIRLKSAVLVYKGYRYSISF